MQAAGFPAHQGHDLGGRVGRCLPIVVAAISVLLLIASGPFADQAKLSSTVGDSFVLVLLAFLVVGVMLARTRVRNPIGWVMLAAAFFGAVTSFAGPYAVDAYRLHHHLPLPWLAAFFQPAWAPAIFLIGLAMMLFPDGVPPPGRWRWALGGLMTVGTIWMLGAFAIAAQTIALNQVVIEPSGDLTRIDHPTSGWAWWSVTQDIFFLTFLLVGLGWLVSRVPAYRKATGDRHQQLKWLIFGGSIACVGIVLSVALSSQSGVLGQIGSLAVIGLVGIPISIGVGMTKYRLYDIDRLISRTLSYTLLTGTLLAVFAALVLLARRVLPFSSPVGVAASTLIVAALFSPLRVRLQRLVDSRFNRSRYDTEALIAAFSIRLREAIDPDAVRLTLLETASQAVEPTHVSVWLRGDPTR